MSLEDLGAFLSITGGPADKAARATAFSEPQGRHAMGTELWGEMEGGPPQWQHRSRRSRNPPRPCNDGARDHM